MQTVQYVRVINSQKTFGNSVLLDKIDRTSGQFETDLGYAQTPKQAVYVPYVNPIDPTVPGYLDLVPSDEVTLQLYQPQGVINQLQANGYVTVVLHHSAAVATPLITASAHVASQSGTHGQFAASAGGHAVFTDSTASVFTSSDVGLLLTVTTSSVPANEGTYDITAFGSATHVTVAFATATVDTAADVWATSGGLTITGPGSGATFVSLTPDHTYVILTNLSGVSQTLKDTAIVAAGGSIAATAIVISDSIVTGGPVVAGWKVQVQANSKLSNVFTVT